MVVLLISQREENVHVSVCKRASVCVVDYVCSVSGITLCTLSESCLAERDMLQVRLLGEPGTKLNIMTGVEGRGWWLLLGTLLMLG